MRVLIVLSTVLTFFASHVTASECDSTSKGFIPLPELTGTYLGHAGGLYPGGSNTPPYFHDSAGLAIAQSFVAMDSFGVPQPNGVWVLLSIGMSNATQEFSEFIFDVTGDTTLHPNLRILDGAQGGQTAAKIKYDTANFWTVIMQRLAQRGLSAKQVQAIWYKEANAGPTSPFPGHATVLRDDIRDGIRVIAQKFPNIRQVFFSSRTYAGYASSALNPEPYAYESGFSVRWVIESQFNFNDSLNYVADSGMVNAPWLAWGPYLWGDGIVPRVSDGLQWFCADFIAADGTHPSPSGRQKVSTMLEGFFKTSPYATPWFLRPGVVLCCIGTTGNVDGDLADDVDITDLTVLVDYLFFGGGVSSCADENNVDADGAGSIDVSDLQMMIDFLFFGASLPACP